ncbi:unnamed protein product [Linum trigynum]|uniref:FBD domain-containing protein n=1 Tax=Linum trigynum TaxID=586398 RepID=A0AAV2GCJ4_9ROSI
MFEYLSVVDWESPPDNLEIVSPSLKSLQLVRMRCGLLKVKGICFKDTPLLSSVQLFFHDTDTLDLATVFASIPTIRKLGTNDVLLQHLTAGPRNVPSGLPSPLHQLEVLEIIDFDYSLDWEHGFVCLIMSSPNLRRLKLQLYRDERKNAVSNLGSSQLRIAVVHRLSWTL